jgi:sigma-54 dependent transcriptional regulator, acetoin dehydrogenase operon transcriptional activator AcoR
MNTHFPSSAQDRIAMARRRYFDEGILPTGIVSSEIFQSWTRCHRSKQESQHRIEFQPVSLSRSQLALQKNRGLHEAWLCELPSLGSALGSASCSAILTDASGTLIGATPSAHLPLRIIPVAHRVGVNLSEACVGTTAPGIVAHTGKSASVLGAEHYFDSVHSMYCMAAPIRNVQGQLAGILDISSEGAPFRFEPSSVVGLYAAAIENRYLVAQSTETLLVRFQFAPNLIDSPMVAMLGFDLTGQLTWLNSLASNLLGLPIAFAARDVYLAEELFDATFADLASLPGRGPSKIRMRSGLHVFVSCELLKNGKRLARESNSLNAIESRLHPASIAPASPTSPAALEAPAPVASSSLRQADDELIHKCLVRFKGNVSMVARHLKVSRGLVYRRLKK